MHNTAFSWREGAIEAKRHSMADVKQTDCNIIEQHYAMEETICLRHHVSSRIMLSNSMLRHHVLCWVIPYYTKCFFVLLFRDKAANIRVLHFFFCFFYIMRQLPEGVQLIRRKWFSTMQQLPFAFLHYMTTSVRILYFALWYYFPRKFFVLILCSVRNTTNAIPFRIPGTFALFSNFGTIITYVCFCTMRRLPVQVSGIAGVWIPIHVT